MVEKRKPNQSNANLTNDQDYNKEGSIQLNNMAYEETKGDTSDDEPKKPKFVSRAPFKRPLTKENIAEYSRWLHQNAPVNRYLKNKVPWRTILVSILFLVIGTILLTIGINEMIESGSVTQSWEKILLGVILFIPGSFHSFLAF